MIYTNAEVIYVNTNPSYAVVYNSDVDQNVDVYLPSVISKLPVIGDSINYYKDDVDNSHGLFISYYDDLPVIPSSSNHIHQLLSDNIINNMALDDTQKADMRTKRTGGIEQ